jgi:hypothetical protein
MEMYQFDEYSMFLFGLFSFSLPELLQLVVKLAESLLLLQCPCAIL